MLKHDFLIGAELELEIPFSKNWPRREAYLALIKSGYQKKKYLNALNFGTFKYDGTISYGFEYATVPFRADFYNRLENKKALKNIFSFFKKHKASTGNHVGMHVHVDKSYLTKEEIQKINYFIYRNSDFCEIIGERKSNKYCRPDENSDEIININFDKYKQFCGDRRYCADVSNKKNHKHRMLNVARPKTIEFRFFKSTNDFNTFLKNIQFVMALVNFAKEKIPTLGDFQIGGSLIRGSLDDGSDIGEIEGMNTIVRKFCTFVHKHNNIYLQLANFLSKRGYTRKKVK